MRIIRDLDKGMDHGKSIDVTSKCGFGFHMHETRQLTAVYCLITHPIISLQFLNL